MTLIRLYKQDPDTLERELLGEITEPELDFLIENLEEEFEEDEAYFINRPTLDYLKDEGAGNPLLELLETALATAPDGIEIAYQYC